MSIFIIISIMLLFMSKLKNKNVLFNNFNQTAQWYAVAFTEARKWGISPFTVLAMIDQESGGNPNPSDGSAGEVGIMQVKQGALTDVINIQHLPFKTLDQIRDVETNIQYATAYLALQFDRVGGNEYDALRAYNQGYAGMDRTDKGQLEKGKAYAKSVISKKTVLKDEFNI